MLLLQTLGWFALAGFELVVGLFIFSGGLGPVFEFIAERLARMTARLRFRRQLRQSRRRIEATFKEANRVMTDIADGRSGWKEW